jgi:HPt (histidine-containing phosphotransfer) domain-containing protein
MTASVMREDRDRCLAAGMDDFLPKPMQIRKLEEILAKWLDTGKHVTGSTAGQDSAAAGSAVLRSGEDIYDLKVLEEKLRFGNKLVVTIIELFNENIPKQIDDLKFAVENNDPKTARRLAHTMKGSSAQMGARKMFTLAAEMEIMAEQGNLTSIGPHIDTLRSAFSTYSLAIAEWRKDIDLKAE